MAYTPPSETIKKLNRLGAIAEELINGLNGKPFTWGYTEGRYDTQRAALLGCTLMTKTALKKAGYKLKRNAKPVGRRYYPASLSKYADLYIVECQCNDDGAWQMRMDDMKREWKQLKAESET